MTLGPNDCEGAPLQVGDRVRIMGLPPDSAEWPQDVKEFSLAVFEHLVGKYKRIDGFGPLGHVEINFRIAKGPKTGLHSIQIEPFLLRKVRSRDAK
jgi:hypothetical protein